MKHVYKLDDHMRAFETTEESDCVINSLAVELISKKQLTLR